jgi:hypothetical protein
VKIKLNNEQTSYKPLNAVVVVCNTVVDIGDVVPEVTAEEVGGVKLVAFVTVVGVVRVFPAA